MDTNHEQMRSKYIFKYNRTKKKSSFKIVEHPSGI